MPSKATTPTKPIMSPTHIDLFCTPELTAGEAAGAAHSGSSRVLCARIDYVR
jgi:hypothetical protein